MPDKQKFKLKLRNAESKIKPARLKPDSETKPNPEIKQYNTASTAFQRFRGLMFSKKKTLLFILPKETRFNAGIHMLFVFYPIEVLWLNKDFRIIDKAWLKPFISFKVPRAKAKYILETPYKTGLKTGSKTNLEKILNLEKTKG